MRFRGAVGALRGQGVWTRVARCRPWPPAPPIGPLERSEQGCPRLPPGSPSRTWNLLDCPRVAGLVWMEAVFRARAEIEAGCAHLGGQDVFYFKTCSWLRGRGNCGCVTCCSHQQLLWALRSFQQLKCGAPPPASVS